MELKYILTLWGNKGTYCRCTSRGVFLKCGIGYLVYWIVRVSSGYKRKTVIICVIDWLFLQPYLFANTWS